MDSGTRLFAIFMAFCLGCLAVGYLARRRRWLSEHVSAPLQLSTLLFAWGPVALVSFWRIPLRGDDAAQLGVLLLSQPIFMLTAAGLMERITRYMRCSRVQRGVLIVGAGLSNTGFTLGAYLCSAMLEPGDLALGYGIAMTQSMALCIVLFFYPIAWHFSRDEGGSTLRRLILESFVDIRATPLYLSLIGVALNLFNVPVPSQIDDLYLMDILFFAGGGAAYMGIGLRLRLGDSLGAWKMHIALGLVQFVAYPIVAAGYIATVTATGFQFNPLVRDVLMLEAFVPTAVNVVILANIFHLDARLASVLWLWNTLTFALIVLPLLIWFF